MQRLGRQDTWSEASSPALERHELTTGLKTDPPLAAYIVGEDNTFFGSVLVFD